jgi:hypothetical protein
MPTHMPRANLNLLIRRERLRQADDNRLFVSRRAAAAMLGVAYHHLLSDITQGGVREPPPVSRRPTPRA